MNRLLYALCLVALVGCGGTSSGYLPVDSPLTKFVPPEPEDLVSDSDSMDNVDVSDDDWGDVGESPDTQSDSNQKATPKSPAPADAK